MTYVFVLYLVSLALGYEIRFREATLHIGRSLSETDSESGFQLAITPPVSAYATFGIYILSLAVVALGFVHYGLPRGLAASIGFVLLVIFNRILLLPKPSSTHFRQIIIRSMIRRHADYLRDGDELRAAAMVEVLERAGVPVSDFINRLRGQGGA